MDDVLIVVGLLLFGSSLFCLCCYKVIISFNNLFMFLTTGVDFTKLCAPSEKTPAHGVWQKNCHSISSTNVQQNNPSLQGIFVLILPNPCSICQICAPFAKHRSPKIASHLVRSYQLVKLTPRRVWRILLHQWASLTKAVSCTCINGSPKTLLTMGWADLTNT